MSAAAETVAAAPRKTAATRSNTVLYTALAVLFLIATSYYVRTLEYRFPQWFGVTTAGMPFHLDAEDQPRFVLFPQPNAQAAGVRYGDLLIAINGVPVTSRSVYADVLAASHPGDTMDVRFQRKGERTLRHTRVVLAKAKGNTDTVNPLALFSPGACRPADSQAHRSRACFRFGLLGFRSSDPGSGTPRWCPSGDCECAEYNCGTPQEALGRDESEAGSQSANSSAFPVCLDGSRHGQFGVIH